MSLKQLASKNVFNYSLGQKYLLFYFDIITNSRFFLNGELVAKINPAQIRFYC